MAAFAGLIHHATSAGQAMTAGQAQTGKGASPMAAQAGATGSTTSSSSSSATISANDFLSLLVTEMQNQDPTANTDPNEYINQLVQVNSLEQLIDINQNLTTALGTGGSTSSTGSSSSVAATSGSAAPAAGLSATDAAAQKTSGATGAHKTAGVAAVPINGSSTAAAISQFAQSVNAKHAPGNLSVPAAKPAAHTVAHALGGHSHARGVQGKLPVYQ
jgi:flagellar basal-body rod modification protein FlgD